MKYRKIEGVIIVQFLLPEGATEEAAARRIIKVENYLNKEVAVDVNKKFDVGIRARIGSERS